jgi:hypothetical protein
MLLCITRRGVAQRGAPERGVLVQTGAVPRAAVGAPEAWPGSDEGFLARGSRPCSVCGRRQAWRLPCVHAAIAFECACACSTSNTSNGGGGGGACLGMPALAEDTGLGRARGPSHTRRRERSGGRVTAARPPLACGRVVPRGCLRGAPPPARSDAYSAAGSGAGGIAMKSRRWTWRARGPRPVGARRGGGRRPRRSASRRLASARAPAAA